MHFIYLDSPHLSLHLGALRAIIECIWWQRQVLSVARKLDAEVDLDIVHHVTWGSLHVGSQLWRLRKPFVFGPIGGGQVAESGFGRYLKGGRMLEALRTLIVRHFTGVLFSARNTVSHSSLVLVTNSETGEWARRLGATRVEFLLDVGMPRSMLSDEERKIATAGSLKVLWVGRLLPRKAVLLALEALSKIDKSVKVSCTILGDGPQGRYLADWIKKLDLADRVVWRGQVGWDAVIKAYSEHDVFLFTSLRDSCGAQLIEAMARGVPIVTLDHHGAHVAVPVGAGIKVPVTTPEQTCLQVARALERLANEPETAARMGNAGRRCADEHTWDRKAARASKLYPSILPLFVAPGESGSRLGLRPAEIVVRLGKDMHDDE